MEYGTNLTRLKQTSKTRHEQKYKREEKYLAFENPPNPVVP